MRITSLMIEAPFGMREACLGFAARIVGRETGITVDPEPDLRTAIRSGEPVLYLKWDREVERTLTKAMVDDLVASHTACGADISLPDKAWLPEMSFTLYGREFGSCLQDAPGVPAPEHFSSCLVNHYVPSVAVVRNHAALLSAYLGRPRGIHMAVAEKCDMGCVMCPFYGADRAGEVRARYNDYMGRREQFDGIDRSGFKAILERFERLQPVSSVSIFGPGEPLRNPHFPDILRFLTERRIAVAMATNGRYLTGKYIETLEHTSLSTIILSVDAATAPTYAAIKPPGDYDRLLRMAGKLRKLRDAGGNFTIKASFIRQEKNDGEEPAFTEIWGEIADEVVFTSKYYLGRPVLDPEWRAHAQLPCGSLGLGLHALTNGDCWACSAGVPDEYGLGNILEEHPETILTRQKGLMRRQLESGEAGPLCRSCVWWRQIQHLEQFENGRRTRIQRPYSYAVPTGDRS